MSTGTAVEEKADVAATSENSLPEVVTAAPKKKEDLYKQMAARLNAQVEKVRGEGRKVFGDHHMRDVMVGVFQGLMEIATQTDESGKAEVGTVGIPGGFGSFQLGTAAATVKKTPQGQVLNVPKRWRFVWKPGKAVDDRLDTLPVPEPDAPVEAAPATPA